MLTTAVAVLLLLCTFLWSRCSPGPVATPSVVLHPSTHDRAHLTTLVTGGLGFIGSHVVEELLSRGHHVVIFDDESNGHNHNKAADFHHGDIKVISDFRQLEALASAVNGESLPIDYVVHLAAAISVAESMTMPEKYHNTNIKGSAKVFFWAMSHGVKHVVAASSAAVYGDPPGEVFKPITEEKPYAGKSPYADSKWGMEKVMESLSNDYDFCATALRFFNVYGPRQDPKNPYSGVISLFMDKAKGGNTISVNGDGGQTRDFVYVKDVARAIVTALLAGNCKFDVFNVCTGAETTIKDLAKTVVGQFKSASTVSNGPVRPGDIMKSVCNPKKLNTKLGFVAKVTVAEGLEHTRDWFLEDTNKAALLK